MSGASGSVAPKGPLDRVRRAALRNDVVAMHALMMMPGALCRLADYAA